MKEYTVKEIRIMRGFTRKQVAEKADISKDYLYMIESGKRTPSDKVKNKLAELYNLPVVQIFLALQRTYSTSTQKEEIKCKKKEQ